MLSLTTEHALRALLVLARQPAGRAMRAAQLAAAIGAPQNYLGKTLGALARAGLLHSSRGPTGGFTLALPVEAITVGQVAEVFREPRPASSHCLLGDRPCDPAHPCGAHRRWSVLTHEALSATHRTSLAHLLAEVPAAGDRRPT